MAYRTETLEPPLKQVEKGCHHTGVTVFMSRCIFFLVYQLDL